MGALAGRSSDVGLLLAAAEIAFHDAGSQFAAAGVERHALGQLGQLIDESDPLHSPVILDQGEGADATAFAHGQDGLFERGDGAARVRRIQQIDEVAFDVGRGLAVGDDENLFVLGPCADW